MVKVVGGGAQQALLQLAEAEADGGGPSPSSVLGRRDSGRKHGGLSGGSGQAIVTAAAAAARVTNNGNNFSDQLPDLGGSDPWSSGGEDDLR